MGRERERAQRAGGLANASLLSGAGPTMEVCGATGMDERPTGASMPGSSLSIGRIFGIEVRVHASWLLAFFFVTWGLATGYFRFVAPRQGLGTLLLLGAISALLVFGS